eukprot:13621370-Ditylum_brightwellii.AAC.1
METIIGRADFSMDNHANIMENERIKGKKNKEEKYVKARGKMEKEYIVDQCCIVERATKCVNKWLVMLPDLTNNIVLGKDELQYMVLLEHKSGLLGAFHNEARDDLGLTASQAYSPSNIHNKPKVNSCQDNKNGKECLETTYQQQVTSDIYVSVIKTKDKEKDPNLYGDILI